MPGSPILDHQALAILCSRLSDLFPLAVATGLIVERREIKRQSLDELDGEGVDLD
jgi:hypothetical protein